MTMFFTSSLAVVCIAACLQETSSQDFGRTGSTGATGFNGLPGPVGQPGPPGGGGGQVGVPGRAGIRGVMGGTGRPGRRGMPGLQGPQGSSAGATGSTGMTGARGDTGSTGFTGPAGAPYGGNPGGIGRLGATGFMGSTGYNGIMGQLGTRGEAGPVGPVGPAGSVGRAGPPGMLIICSEATRDIPDCVVDGSGVVEHVKDKKVSRTNPMVALHKRWEHKSWAKPLFNPYLLVAMLSWLILLTFSIIIAVVISTCCHGNPSSLAVIPNGKPSENHYESDNALPAFIEI